MQLLAGVEGCLGFRVHWGKGLVCKGFAFHQRFRLDSLLGFGPTPQRTLRYVYGSEQSDFGFYGAGLMVVAGP